MTEYIDKTEATRRFKPFGREIPKEQVMAVLARIDEGIVRCKDCRWYDNRYGEVCHNPRYGDGHANYQPPYVDENYWCKDGKGKGGDEE